MPLSPFPDRNALVAVGAAGRLVVHGGRNFSRWTAWKERGPPSRMSGCVTSVAGRRQGPQGQSTAQGGPDMKWRERAADTRTLETPEHGLPASVPRRPEVGRGVSAMDWQSAITTVVTTIGTSAVAIGIVAWLVRALIAHGLARDRAIQGDAGCRARALSGGVPGRSSHRGAAAADPVQLPPCSPS